MGRMNLCGAFGDVLRVENCVAVIDVEPSRSSNVVWTRQTSTSRLAPSALLDVSLELSEPQVFRRLTTKDYVKRLRPSWRIHQKSASVTHRSPILSPSQNRSPSESGKGTPKSHRGSLSSNL